MLTQRKREDAKYEEIPTPACLIEFCALQDYDIFLLAHASMQSWFSLAV